MEEILKKIILAVAKAKSHKPEKVVKTLEQDVLQGDEDALKVMALVIGAMANYGDDEEDVVILVSKELARRMRYAASQQQNK